MVAQPWLPTAQPTGELGSGGAFRSPGAMSSSVLEQLRSAHEENLPGLLAAWWLVGACGLVVGWLWVLGGCWLLNGFGGCWRLLAVQGFWWFLVVGLDLLHRHAKCHVDMLREFPWDMPTGTLTCQNGLSWHKHFVHRIAPCEGVPCTYLNSLVPYKETVRAIQQRRVLHSNMPMPGFWCAFAIFRNLRFLSLFLWQWRRWPHYWFLSDIVNPVDVPNQTVDMPKRPFAI